MPLDKSLGPNGYSIEFLRASWDIVGEDVIAAVKEFFRNGRLFKDLNSTAITVIPKKPEACKLGDYRCISCCNIAYKVISKIIANILKPILQDCISLNKAVFLKGRSLGENVNRFSRNIRNMLQLKHILVDFLHCEVGNGVVASFWYDSWTVLGPLISYMGKGA